MNQAPAITGTEGERLDTREATIGTPPEGL
jgi:hypothetical protein